MADTGATLSAFCPGRCGVDGEDCERVHFALLDVSSGTCDGRGARAPFALQQRGALGLALRVAADGALDREACDEYEVLVNATNEGGWSIATITVVVHDANDLVVSSATRKGGGALDELSTRGGDVVVFEGSGLGRVDPAKPPVIVGHYASSRADSPGAAMLEATDCGVERPGVAVRCTTVAGTGGPLTWYLIVDGLVVFTDALPMWYATAMVERIDGPGARVDRRGAVRWWTYGAPALVRSGCACGRSMAWATCLTPVGCRPSARSSSATMSGASAHDA